MGAEEHVHGWPGTDSRGLDDSVDIGLVQGKECLASVTPWQVSPDRTLNVVDLRLIALRAFHLSSACQTTLC